MKKLLISIMIILCCILTLITGLKGIHLGNINILGIQEIKKENANLETKLNQATSLAGTDYPNKISTINADVKAMKKLSAAYHVNLQDEWLAQMSKKYGEGNVRVVERALKTL